MLINKTKVSDFTNKNKKTNGTTTEIINCIIMVLMPCIQSRKHLGFRNIIPIDKTQRLIQNTNVKAIKKCCPNYKKDDKCF
jgi:hypothetical protein